MSPALAPAVSNIVRVFAEASDADRFAGIDWYPEARAIAVELDPECPERAAAVIAALSPMMPWQRNVLLARIAYALHAADLIGDGTILPCLVNNGRKAARILAGEPADSVLKGDKVRAFWQTITSPSDPDKVVVDRHALDVSLGITTDDVFRARYLSNKRNYAAVAALYREAAVIIAGVYGIAITPAQVQAVTWVAWRNALKAAGSKRKPRKVKAAEVALAS